MAIKELGPSVGEYHGRPIPAYIIDEAGIRSNYDRLAVEKGGRVELSQLSSDECVIAPGLIYRRST